MTEHPAHAEEEDAPVAPTEWIPVAKWPPEMKDVITDLQHVEDVLRLMTGGGRQGDHAYGIARSFLAETQLNLRSDLAARVLALHNLDALLEEPEESERAI